jgi:molybdopterin converting factor small subunit
MAPPRLRFVTFAVPGVLRKDCGGASELELSAGTIRDALGELEQRFPRLHRNLCDETGAVRKHIALFVNSEQVHSRESLDMALEPGDVFVALPAVSGG